MKYNTGTPVYSVLPQKLLTLRSLPLWTLIPSQGNQRSNYVWRRRPGAGIWHGLWSWLYESESCSVVSNSLRPHGLYSPWNSLGQNTGVGSLSLLQQMFPTQKSNPGLRHCRQILYQLSYQGRKYTLGRSIAQVSSNLCPRLPWKHSLPLAHKDQTWPLRPLGSHMNTTCSGKLTLSFLISPAASGSIICPHSPLYCPYGGYHHHCQYLVGHFLFPVCLPC